MTKDGIYDYLEQSNKTVVVADCENSDPYKLYAALKNLDEEALLSKIVKIILFDDIHAASAWRILDQFTQIPTEHILIDRVKESKSLVDISLAAGTCREFYQNNVDSFVIVSSDSDYWGLIKAMPDARFLVMVEYEKCGRDIKAAMVNSGIFYCFIDDFCTGNSDEVQRSALLREIKGTLKEAVSFNVNDMLREAYAATRVTMSTKEKQQFYDRYIKAMQLKIDKDGNVTVELA